MRYHSYKNKPGGYWRGRSRAGGFYTRSGAGCGGCLMSILAFLVLSVATLAFALAKQH